MAAHNTAITRAKPSMPKAIVSASVNSGIAMILSAVANAMCSRARRIAPAEMPAPTTSKPAPSVAAARMSRAPVSTCGKGTPPAFTPTPAMHATISGFLTTAANFDHADAAVSRGSAYSITTMQLTLAIGTITASAIATSAKPALPYKVVASAMAIMLFQRTAF